MEIAAKMSSKGQLTVPKSVRDALGIGEGDEVIFRDRDVSIGRLAPSAER